MKNNKLLESKLKSLSKSKLESKLELVMCPQCEKKFKIKGIDLERICSHAGVIEEFEKYIKDVKKVCKKDIYDAEIILNELLQKLDELKKQYEVI